MIRTTPAAMAVAFARTGDEAGGEFGEVATVTVTLLVTDPPAESLTVRVTSNVPGGAVAVRRVLRRRRGVVRELPEEGVLPVRW